MIFPARTAIVTHVIILYFDKTYNHSTLLPTSISYELLAGKNYHQDIDTHIQDNNIYNSSINFKCGNFHMMSLLQSYS